MADIGPGRLFAGYVIERELGRGGMGVVYLAHQAQPARHVGLKILSPGLAADVSFRARFDREARLIATVEHPNVVPVYTTGEEDGHLYLAMRYIEGGDLGFAIRTRGVPPVATALRILQQVASALGAALARGLIHRDVKPANILLDGDFKSPHTYLGDFGLARLATSGTALTSTGLMMGTPDYLAPEVWEGSAAGIPTDVYALGCVLFELLTGDVPYPHDSDAAKMRAHCDGPLPLLGAAHSHDLQRVLDCALAKSPRDRFASAAALAQATEQALAGQRPAIPVTLGPGRELRPTSPTRRLRRRAMGSVAVLAVLVVLAGAIGALYVTETWPFDDEIRPPTGTTNSTTGVANTGTTTPPEPKPPLVIKTDLGTGVITDVGPFKPQEDPTLRAATKAFGQWTILGDGGGDITACDAQWRKLGISLGLANFGGGDACSDRGGLTQYVEISGVNDRWRTDEGLAAGMPENAIVKRYPDAKVKSGEDDFAYENQPAHDTAWELASAKFAEIPVPTSTLTAFVRNEEVVGFELWLHGAGD